jgi:transcriptional regulator with XRE-family HTH domain
MDLTRDGVRAWLLDVLARNDETPTALARRAGVAQTTLTRFLNEIDGPMLSLRTLARVAHVAGSAPPGFEPPAALSSAARPSGLEDADAAPLDAAAGLAPHVSAALAELRRGRQAADVWIMQGRALEHAGVLPGDLLVVDLGITAESGDLVCAQHYRWARAQADTIFRIYDTPYLLAASSDASLRKPLVVDNERVIIKGVVLAVMRTR